MPSPTRGRWLGSARVHRPGPTTRPPRARSRGSRTARTRPTTGSTSSSRRPSPRARRTCRRREGGGSGPEIRGEGDVPSPIPRPAVSIVPSAIDGVPGGPGPDRADRPGRRGGLRGLRAPLGGPALPVPPPDDRIGRARRRGETVDPGPDLHACGGLPRRVGPRVVVPHRVAGGGEPPPRRGARRGGSPAGDGPRRGAPPGRARRGVRGARGAPPRARPAAGGDPRGAVAPRRRGDEPRRDRAVAPRSRLDPALPALPRAAAPQARARLPFGGRRKRCSAVTRST